MKRQKVRSSNIAEIGYEEDTETLEILFVTGGLYQYSGVPYEAYKAFLQAGSLGQWFQTHIRGRFDFRRMNPKCPRCGKGIDSNRDGDCTVCAKLTDAQADKLKHGEKHGQSKEKGKTQASSETLADA